MTCNCNDKSKNINTWGCGCQEMIPEPKSRRGVVKFCDICDPCNPSKSNVKLCAFVVPTLEDGRYYRNSFVFVQEDDSTYYIADDRSEIPFGSRPKFIDDFDPEKYTVKNSVVFDMKNKKAFVFDEDSYIVFAVGDATLYSGTGVNTDGSMTQLAASNLIFPSGSEITKDKIAVGNISNAENIGQNTIQIVATSNNANPITSIGAVSLTSGTTGLAGNYGVELGNRTSVGDFGVAIGSNVKASENNIAVGSSVQAFGEDSAAIGYGARTGNSEENANDFAIALGAHSITSRDSEVSIGSGAGSTGYTTRYLANVKTPVLDTDAATKKYVDDLIATLEARVAALEG